jgi:hypothetical protein
MGDALSGCEFALFVLAIDRSTATGVECLLAKPAELFDASLGTHRRPLRMLTESERFVGLISGRNGYTLFTASSRGSHVDPGFGGGRVQWHSGAGGGGSPDSWTGSRF